MKLFLGVWPYPPSGSRAKYGLVCLSLGSSRHLPVAQEVKDSVVKELRILQPQSAFERVIIARFSDTNSGGLPAAVGIITFPNTSIRLLTRKARRINES